MPEKYEVLRIKIWLKNSALIELTERITRIEVFYGHYTTVSIKKGFVSFPDRAKHFSFFIYDKVILEIHTKVSAIQILKEAN